MSGLGQERRFCNVRIIPLHPQKADIHRKGRHIPKEERTSRSSSNDLVSERQQRWRNFECEA